MSRILFLVPRMNIGGAETYVFTVAKELLSRGKHEVFVASAGGKLSEELSSLGVKNFFVPVRFSKKLSVFLLKRIVKKYNIDIIHANSGDAGVIAAFLKKDIDIPVVYTAHGIFGNIEREYVINTVNKIICVSEFVRQRALKQSFDDRKLLTKYCGINIKKFTSNSNVRDELRRKYRISDSTLVLGTVSRIKNLEHKGHIDLIELFSRFASNDDWKLFIIGKGNGLIKLKHLIKSKNLQDKIVCLGHRTDVSDLLNLIDVYVSPTRAETFGLAIAEALAMSKPAVVYKICGTAEVFRDGDAGFFAKYKDVSDMYSKIKILDNDRELLAQMSINARKWVEENFSIEQMVDDLEKIYIEVLPE